jgi:hypothetical protein
MTILEATHIESWIMSPWPSQHARTTCVIRNSQTRRSRLFGQGRSSHGGGEQAEHAADPDPRQLGIAGIMQQDQRARETQGCSDHRPVKGDGVRFSLADARPGPTASRPCFSAGTVVSDSSSERSCMASISLQRYFEVGPMC